MLIAEKRDLSPFDQQNAKNARGIKMSEKIVSYTSEELAAMRSWGESGTDWQRVTTSTDADIEAAIAADPESEEITEEDWQRARLTVPLELEPEMMEIGKKRGRIINQAFN